MRFILTIDCEGDSFGHDPAFEVAAILQRLLDRAPGYSHRNLWEADPTDRNAKNPFLFYDDNGNRVGTAFFDTEDSILKAAQTAVDAAAGDSNDWEIEALQMALEEALGALGLAMPEPAEVDE